MAGIFKFCPKSAMYFCLLNLIQIPTQVFITAVIFIINMKKSRNFFVQFFKITGIVNYCVQVGCQSEQVSCQSEAKRPCRSEAEVAALVGRPRAASEAFGMCAAFAVCMACMAYVA